MSLNNDKSGYSTEQKVKMVKWYLESKSPKYVQKQYQGHYECHYRNLPSRQYISKITQKFMESGSVKNLYSNAGAPRVVRTKENISSVENIIQDNPKTSVRKVSQAAALSRSSTQRILSDDLELYPYKIQIVQALTDSAQRARKEFAEKCLECITQNENFLQNIWFSDEAHFYLYGYVNTQNARIWEQKHLLRSLRSL